MALTATSNSVCDPLTVAAAAAGVSPALRAAAAANPSIVSELLHQMAEDPDPGVRAKVVANPACPPLVRARLGGDRSLLVVAAAVHAA